MTRIGQILVGVLALGACGTDGNDDLDPGVVTTLPEGDGVGTAASGAYRMEALTTRCSGSCIAEVDGFTYSACDVGVRLEDTVTVTQTDGALVVDVDDSDYVSRLAGGIDVTGAFDIGGLRTQFGGAITITARSTGIVAGAWTGEARLHVRGRGLDCAIRTEVTGARR